MHRLIFLCLIFVGLFFGVGLLLQGHGFMSVGYHVEWVDTFFNVLEHLEDLVCFWEGVDETVYFFILVWQGSAALLIFMHFITFANANYY